MTTQIVGFVDEIPQTEVDAMARGVAGRLADLDPIQAEIGKVLFFSEGVVLGIRPPHALDPIRTAIRDAVAEAVSVHQLADEPDWTPHLSVAYSHGDGPAAPVIDALADRPDPRPLTVREVHLVSQERTGRLYRWDRLTAAALGG
jgi:2'-5' RNA ligase